MYIDWIYLKENVIYNHPLLLNVFFKNNPHWDKKEALMLQLRAQVAQDDLCNF